MHEYLLLMHKETKLGEFWHLNGKETNELGHRRSEHNGNYIDFRVEVRDKPVDALQSNTMPPRFEKLSMRI